MEFIVVIGNSHICQKLSKILLQENQLFLYLPGELLSTKDVKELENIPYVVGDYHNATFLLENKIQDATSIIIAEKSDEANIVSTLLVRDLNPAAKIIVEFLSDEIGSKISKELPNCFTLSASTLSAPTFAAASIFRHTVFSFHFEQSIYSIVKLPLEKTIGLENERKNHFESCHQVKIIYYHDGNKIIDGKDFDIFPKSGDLVFFIPAKNLESLKKYIPQVSSEIILPKETVKLSFDRFLLSIILTIFTVIFSATCYFHYQDNLSWLNAVYFVITTLSTVGYGDFSLKDSLWTSKLVGMLLMLSGLSLTALFFAIVTNAFIQKRNDYIEGRKKYHLKNHIIICGLGKVGLKIIDNLISLNQQVLVIENKQNNLMLKEIQRRDIPFMIANAKEQKTLLDANIQKAKSIICAINDDLLCLEIGLMARSINPAIRVVLRIFDESIAERIQKYLNINIALSTSYLSSRSLLAYSTLNNVIAVLPALKKFDKLGVFQKNATLPENSIKLVAGYKDLVIFSD